MFTATNLDRVVTNNETLLSIKSQDPMIMWFCKVMWQIKYVTFPLLQ